MIYVNYLLNEMKFIWYIKCLVWWVNYYRIYGEIKVANKLSRIYSRLIYQSKAGLSRLSADHWNTNLRIDLSFLGDQYQLTIEIIAWSFSSPFWTVSYTSSNHKALISVIYDCYG